MVAAAGLPDFFAGLLVEGPDQASAVGVAVLHDQVADDDRAGGCSPGAGELAEVPRPKVLALPGYKRAARRGRRTRRQSRRRSRKSPTPSRSCRGSSRARPSRPIAARGFRRSCDRRRRRPLLPLIQGRGQKNPVAPDDRRRLPTAGERRFPDDVVADHFTGSSCRRWPSCCGPRQRGQLDSAPSATPKTKTADYKSDP